MTEARPLWSKQPRRLNVSAKTAQRLCDLAAVATAAAFAASIAEVAAARRRSPSAALARQSAMYLAHVTFGLNFSEVGRAFGRDRTTVAHACRRVEERRDDPSIDDVLSALEDACAALRRKLEPGAQA
jgi:chromosomal replication initiation ATPase DnaA